MGSPGNLPVKKSQSTARLSANSAAEPAKTRSTMSPSPQILRTIDPELTKSATMLSGPGGFRRRFPECSSQCRHTLQYKVTHGPGGRVALPAPRAGEYRAAPRATIFGSMASDWPDPKFRNLTPAFLAALSTDDIGDAILQHVEWRVRAHRGDRAAA